jgi:hypothetical protein
MEHLDYVEEFHNIDNLKLFLNKNNRENKYVIKKIFRSPDGVYFIWFQYIQTLLDTEEK